jgi:hypothetical protein
MSSDEEEKNIVINAFLFRIYSISNITVPSMSEEKNIIFPYANITKIDEPIAAKYKALLDTQIMNLNSYFQLKLKLMIVETNYNYRMAEGTKKRKEAFIRLSKYQNTKKYTEGDGSESEEGETNTSEGDNANSIGESKPVSNEEGKNSK